MNPEERVPWGDDERSDCVVCPLDSPQPNPVMDELMDIQPQNDVDEAWRVIARAEEAKHQ